MTHCFLLWSYWWSISMTGHTVQKLAPLTSTSVFMTNVYSDKSIFMYYFAQFTRLSLWYLLKCGSSVAFISLANFLNIFSVDIRSTTFSEYFLFRQSIFLLIYFSEMSFCTRLSYGYSVWREIPSAMYKLSVVYNRFLWSKVEMILRKWSLLIWPSPSFCEH